MSFQLFEQTTCKSRGVFVTLLSNGQIHVSAGAVDKYNLSNKRACRLYLDKEQQMVGMEFIDTANLPATHKVGEWKNSNRGRTISASRFCNYHKLALPQRALPISEQKMGGTLLLTVSVRFTQII